MTHGGITYISLLPFSLREDYSVIIWFFTIKKWKLLRQEGLDFKTVWTGWLSLSLESWDLCIWPPSWVLGMYFTKALTLFSSCKYFLHDILGIYLRPVSCLHKHPVWLSFFVWFILGDWSFTSCPSLCHPWFMCHFKEHPMDCTGISFILCFKAPKFEHFYFIITQAVQPDRCAQRRPKSLVYRKHNALLFL